MPVIARRFLIRGRVQGVGFRYFAQRSAARHQVRGFVRNLGDGRVEAWAQGDAASVKDFGEDMAAGPQYSLVEDIDEEVVDPDKRYSAFRIER